MRETVYHFEMSLKGQFQKKGLEPMPDSEVNVGFVKNKIVIFQEVNDGKTILVVPMEDPQNNRAINYSYLICDDEYEELKKQKWFGASYFEGYRSKGFEIKNKRLWIWGIY